MCSFHEHVVGEVAPGDVTRECWNAGGTTKPRSAMRSRGFELG